MRNLPLAGVPRRVRVERMKRGSGYALEMGSYAGVLTGFLILGYYSVVAGWTLEYVWQAASFGLSGKTSGEYVSMFQDFSQQPFRPLLWLFVFMFVTHFVIVKGVKDGIEKSSKIMMPLLFVLVILLAGCSIMLPGAEKGIKLLHPDFSKVTPDVFLGAMGQAFFSMSLGMGCLSTYASYFGKETRLGHTAMSVGLIDTCVAVLAGLIIFPAAFFSWYPARCRSFFDIYHFA